MNILQVVEPARDGVFRHVEDLIHFLTERNHQVSLAYSDRRVCDRLPQLLDWVQQHGGAVLNLRVGNAPEAADIRAILALRRFILDRQFQVIHAHSSKAGGLTRLLSLRGRMPKLFYTPHAYFAMNGQRGPVTTIFRMIERALAKAAITVNVSEDEAAFAREDLGVGPSKQLVIPNPVDTNYFQPSSPREKAAARASLGLPPHAIVVGAIGRLSYQKNPQMLYNAFARIANKRADVFLFHVGDGVLQRQVDALRDHFQLSGSVLQMPYLPDTRQFYHAVDMLLMTSRFEGLSYAVLEALSSNLPLILTDVPGNRDFFRLELSHLEKCPTDDAAECARKIDAMCERIEKPQPLNHRDVAIRRFGLEACFEKLVAEYQSQP